MDIPSIPPVPRIPRGTEQKAKRLSRKRYHADPMIMQLKAQEAEESARRAAEKIKKELIGE